MLDPVHASLPGANAIPGRAYLKPIAVLVALTALAGIVYVIVRSLRGRIQPIDSSKVASGRKLIAQFKDDLKNCSDPQSRGQILANRAEYYLKIAENSEGDLKVENEDKALEDLDDALECKPERELCLKIYYVKGTIFARRDLHTYALNEYTLALALKPTDQDFLALLHFKMGLSWFACGADDEAIACFNKAEDCEPSDKNFLAEILVYCSRAYRSNKQPDEALDALTKALGCRPQDVEKLRNIYKERAAIQEEKGDILGAVADLSEALECKPLSQDEHFQLLHKRGSLRYTLGRKDLAMPDLAEAFKFLPMDHNAAADFWRLMGIIYAERGDLQSAEVHLTAAINCKPAQGLDRCLLARGKVYLAQERFDEAILDFTAAIPLAANDETKAWLYLYLGDANQGKDCLGIARIEWIRAKAIRINNEQLRQDIEARLSKK